MRKRRGQEGFSLIELAACLVLVVTSLLGTTVAILSGSTLSSEVARMRASARAASSVMEQVRSTDFVDLVTTFDGSEIEVTSGESGLENGTAHVTVRQVDNGSTQYIVYEVAVDVRFDGVTNAESHPIVTYVSDRVAGGLLSTASVTSSDTVVESQ
jgi:type II secretory pathway pseudopilin PulG